MNFYLRQAEARRTTRWLVVLFVLAVLAVVTTVNFIVLTVVFIDQSGMFGLPSGEWMHSHPGAVVLTTGLVLAVVGLSSLYKSVRLAEGGGAVARALGGSQLSRHDRDPLRRRLYNVVEEMAIASGVPLPEIYVLEHEDGINAFAAGYLPANAAVAVTRGALEKLNRSELQGVIAHEFGHVLNGDMRINTRLIGLLFGLLVVALIGRTILRFGGRSRKSGMAVVLAAAALIILGYLGVFFGRIIQAAISRRRETLADASAVQFTRDPLGLKGALVKIGGLGTGSHLRTPEVDEVAHMLFAPGMARIFDTHPPLIERIKTLDPSFKEQEFATARADPQLSASEAPPVKSPAADRARREILPAVIAAAVGNFDGRQIRAAHGVAGSLPTALLDNKDGPTGVLLALALDSAPAMHARQLLLIAECLGAKGRDAVAAVHADLVQLQRAQRLPMLHAAIPELHRLPGPRRRKLLECVSRLILIDGRVDVHEYVVATVARVYLQDELQPLAQPRAMTFRHVIVELQSLFSTLARFGHENETQAERAYEAGVRHLLPHRRLPYKPVGGWAMALDRSLRCLDRLRPADKEQFIQALVKTISHDGEVTVDEVELLRAICAAIHCPLPTLLN